MTWNGNKYKHSMAAKGIKTSNNLNANNNYNEVPISEPKDWSWVVGDVHESSKREFNGELYKHSGTSYKQKNAALRNAMYYIVAGDKAIVVPVIMNNEITGYYVYYKKKTGRKSKY